MQKQKREIQGERKREKWRKKVMQQPHQVDTVIWLAGSCLSLSPMFCFVLERERKKNGKEGERERGWLLCTFGHFCTDQQQHQEARRKRHIEVNSTALFSHSQRVNQAGCFFFLSFQFIFSLFLPPLSPSVHFEFLIFVHFLLFYIPLIPTYFSLSLSLSLPCCSFLYNFQIMSSKCLCCFYFLFLFFSVCARDVGVSARERGVVLRW